MAFFRLHDPPKNRNFRLHDPLVASRFRLHDPVMNGLLSLGSPFLLLTSAPGFVSPKAAGPVGPDG